MNKFTVLFITKNNQKFNLDFNAKDKKGVLAHINQMLRERNSINFFGDPNSKFINLNEVVYFEIKGGK
jgi:hypothetical protein